MRVRLPEPTLAHNDFVDLGPIIDPPFADAVRRSPRTELHDRREVIPEPWEPPLTDDLLRRALAVTMRSRDVERELEGHRYEVIGVGLLEFKEEGFHPVVVVYRYTDDRVLEAMLDPQAIEVRRIQLKRGQPALTDSEVERARDIASGSSALREAGIDFATGMAIAGTDENRNSPRFRHRLADLRFALPDHRMPNGFAIVDLSSDDLVHSGVFEGRR